MGSKYVVAKAPNLSPLVWLNDLKYAHDWKAFTSTWPSAVALFKVMPSLMSFTSMSKPASLAAGDLAMKRQMSESAPMEPMTILVVSVLAAAGVLAAGLSALLEQATTANRLRMAMDFLMACIMRSPLVVGVV